VTDYSATRLSKMPTNSLPDRSNHYCHKCEEQEHLNSVRTNCLTKDDPRNEKQGRGSPKIRDAFELLGSDFARSTLNR
jgi:hypothetical protein